MSELPLPPLAEHEDGQSECGCRPSGWVVGDLRHLGRRGHRQRPHCCREATARLSASRCRARFLGLADGVCRAAFRGSSNDGSGRVLRCDCWVAARRLAVGGNAGRAHRNSSGLFGPIVSLGTSWTRVSTSTCAGRKAATTRPCDSLSNMRRSASRSRQPCPNRSDARSGRPPLAHPLHPARHRRRPQGATGPAARLQKAAAWVAITPNVRPFDEFIHARPQGAGGRGSIAKPCPNCRRRPARRCSRRGSSPSRRPRQRGAPTRRRPQWLARRLRG